MLLMTHHDGAVFDSGVTTKIRRMSLESTSHARNALVIRHTDCTVW